MKAALEAKIAEVKLTKASKAFEQAAQVCGSEAAALRSYDCKSRHEAIKMLAVVQEWRIVKVDGVVTVL